MDWTLEVVVVPVSDIDRAKEFYADRLGFNVDHDTEIDASLATLRHPFRPRCVVVDGNPLSGERWNYMHRQRRLRIALRARRATILARADC